MGDFTLVLQQLAKPGTRVKKGDVVAEFDRQNMLNRLDDFKAAVIQEEADIKKMKADLEVSEKAHEQLIRSSKAELDKARLDLKTTPARSAIESEILRLAVEEAEARHKQLLNEVKFLETSQRAELHVEELERDQAKIELRRVQGNVDKMLMRAPIDGTAVMQTTWRGGEFGQVQQGDQLWPGQLFMQVVDPSTMVINATVNQTDVELLRLGAKARVHFDAYPDLELPAYIYGIGAMAKPGGMRASYMREVPIRLRLEKMDPRVIPDLSVSADVVLESEKQAPVAPREAVFTERTARKPFVFLQQASGWERREVELGVSNHVAVAVRSGLREGDVIAAEWPLRETKK